MTQHTQPIPMDYRITFRAWDMERLGILQRFFNALKRWSEQEYPTLSRMDRGEDDKRNPGDITLSRRPQMGVKASDDTVATAVNRGQITTGSSAVDKPELWLLNFRPQDMTALGLPDHAQATHHLRDWRTMSRKERKAQIKGDEGLATLADFADMIGNFKGLEVVFVRCAIIEHDRAIMEYRTALPDYQSRSAIEELLLFFGFPHIL